MVLPIKGFCKHSTLKIFKSRHPHFRFIRGLQIFDFAVQAFLLWPIFSYFVYLPIVCSMENKSLCLIMLTDEIFCVSTCAVSFIHQLQFQTKTLEANGWSRIVEARRNFGVKQIMGWKKTRSIIMKRNIMNGLFNILVYVSSILQFVISYDNLEENEPRKLLQMLAFTFQSYICLDLTQRFKIIGTILHSVKKTLMTDYERPSKDFVKYSKLILAIHVNLRVFHKTIILPLMSWILMTIVSLILNIFLLIQFSEYPWYAIVLIHARTAVTVLSIVIILSNAEQNLKRKVSVY